jgi:protoporphyrinogen oxidase
VYERRAAVRIGSLGLTIPYPLQAHFEGLGAALARTIAGELEPGPGQSAPPRTLRDWLEGSFGATLCGLFFGPFHDRYTAGLTSLIAPQDSYKSPAGAEPGYNASFRYPVGGLDVLAARLGQGCDIRYGKRLVSIDRRGRSLGFADGSESGYDRVLSTLPLHQVVSLASLEVTETPDPYTSVLVLNVGGPRGPSCPQVHWQYEPDSRSAFHRIGFYSNVDTDFLPAGRRGGSHVSMYVERAFAGGHLPSPLEVSEYSESVISELQERGYIGIPEAVHASWVEVAYTWRLPGSRWKETALEALDSVRIHQVGRYGRWHFQGIADSVRDGADAGRSLLG